MFKTCPLTCRHLADRMRPYRWVQSSSVRSVWTALCYHGCFWTAVYYNIAVWTAVYYLRSFWTAVCYHRSVWTVMCFHGSVWTAVCYSRSVLTVVCHHGSVFTVVCYHRSVWTVVCFHGSVRNAVCCHGTVWTAVLSLRSIGIFLSNYYYHCSLAGYTVLIFQQPGSFMVARWFPCGRIQCQAWQLYTSSNWE